MGNYREFYDELMSDSEVKKEYGALEPEFQQARAMMNACKADGTPKPEYKVYEKSNSLVLQASEKYMLLATQLYGKNGDNAFSNAEVGNDVGKDVGKDVANNVVDNVVDNVAESNDGNHTSSAYGRRKRLMELISENASITIAEMALIIGVTRRTVDRDLFWLREHGYIGREGKTKKGSWRIIKELIE